MSRVLAWVLIAGGVLCFVVGVVLLVLRWSGMWRDPESRAGWRMMQQRVDPTVLRSPAARQVFDDLRRSNPELVEGTYDHVQQFLEDHADDPDPLKHTRRFANAVVLVGVMGPGLVGLGVFSVAAGTFWLRSL